MPSDLPEVEIRVQMIEHSIRDLTRTSEDDRSRLIQLESRVQSQETYQHVIEQILSEIKNSIAEIKSSVHIFAEQIVSLRLEAGKGKMAQELARMVLFGAAAVVAGMLIDQLR